MLSLLISASIGAGICFLCLIPKLKYKVAENNWIKEQNLKIEIDNNKLKAEQEDLKFKLNDYYQILTHKKNEVDLYDKEIDNQKNTLNNLNTTIQDKINSISIVYDNAKKDCEKEYLDTLKDWVTSYRSKVREQQQEIKQYQEQIENYKSKQNAITEQLKREEEKKEKEQYYKININSDDYDDILLLRGLAQQLQNKEVLNKVIWKSYFEKPTNELIGRLMGDKTITGIYKLTNTVENKAYIGQAVDIAARFKQHIKRGLGAETPLKNKLYPAMMDYGVENFTFEILQQCDRSELNDREKFWIDYFDTKTYGYNVTSGGS